LGRLLLLSPALTVESKTRIIVGFWTATVDSDLAAIPHYVRRVVLAQALHQTSFVLKPVHHRVAMPISGGGTILIETKNFKAGLGAIQTQIVFACSMPVIRQPQRSQPAAALEIQISNTFMTAAILALNQRKMASLSFPGRDPQETIPIVIDAWALTLLGRMHS